MMTADNTVSVPFRNEVDDLFRRIPVMSTVQFARTMTLVTGYEDLQLADLIYQQTRSGTILVSENGLVTTKSAIWLLPEKGRQMPSVNMTGQVRVEAFEPQARYRRCMECYNLVLDMYPESADFFCHGGGLFHMTFIHHTRELEYELIRIPRDREDLYAGLLVKDSMRLSGPYGQMMRDATRRIAVVESEAAAKAVPHVGFTFVCVNDRSSSKGYRIVEKRTQDIWRDFREV